jgi:hypothetical protein
MSRKIVVQFEIRDLLILKDSLKELGFTNFIEKGQDVVELQRAYHNIVFNAKTGNVSYDEVNIGEVNSIKQKYMVNFYKDQAIKEGMNLSENKLQNGDIELLLS